MKKSGSGLIDVVLFLAPIMASAVTMLWLFWRFPISTTITAFIVLAGLGLSVKLAKSTDTEADSDLDQGEHSL